VSEREEKTCGDCPWWKHLEWRDDDYGICLAASHEGDSFYSFATGRWGIAPECRARRAFRVLRDEVRELNGTFHMLRDETHHTHKLNDLQAEQIGMLVEALEPFAKVHETTKHPFTTQIITISNSDYLNAYKVLQKMKEKSDVTT